MNEFGTTIDSVFFGHVEMFSENISGWAWNPEDHTIREIVDVYCDDVLVQSTKADLFRKDLFDAGIGDGRYGFSAPSIPIRSDCKVEIVARSTGVKLRISDPVFNSAISVAGTGASVAVGPSMERVPSSTAQRDHNPAHAAEIDETIAEKDASTPVAAPIVIPTFSPMASAVMHSALTLSEGLAKLRDQGAALDGERDAASLSKGDRQFAILMTPQFSLAGAIDAATDDVMRKITLYVDDNEEASTIADKPTPADLTNSHGERAGFYFQLPDPPKDAVTRKIRVVWGKLARETIADYTKRYRGNFERYELAGKSLRVAGWIQDLMREFSPVAVDVVYNNVILGTFVAKKTRSDLKANAIGMGNHSFDNIVPCLIDAIDVTKLQITVSGTIVPLAKSKLASFDTASSLLSRNKAANPETAPRALKGFSIAVGKTSQACGNVDAMNRSEIRGWAFDPDDPEAPVVLDLLIDNQLVATTKTDRFRPDLAQKFNTSGYHGFGFEVLPQYGRVGWRKFMVAVRRGNVLNAGAQDVQVLPDHVSLEPSRPKAKHASAPRPGVDDNVEFSLIILNLNGESVLRELFLTLERYESNRSFEVLIVDHGSTDGSVEVCEDYRHLNVKVLARGRNFSFSNSNNYAARLAKGSIVICLNNDIFWCQPILDNLRQAFEDETIGCVGVQLLDSPIDADELTTPIVQTIGIHFNMHLRDRAIHPVETRFDSTMIDSYFGSADVPCVTGAFLAVRAKDFAEIGGFDESYHYGYEDVDLCLKIVFNLKRRVVCRNQVRAFHHRGYSRKKTGKWGGGNMLRNRACLEQNFAFRVRRDLLGNLFDKSRFWQGKPLVIAFAVTEAANNTAAGDFFTAAEFGEALQRRLGVDVIFLEEKKNWYDVLGVDVLIVMRHEYQLDKVINKKSTLITIGWARNWFHEWAQASQSRDYNFVAASGDHAVAYLQSKLGRKILKLNIATNAERFKPEPGIPKQNDVIFTGNFWGHPREVAYMFRPEFFAGNFRVFGAGWDHVAHWAPYAEGLKAYAELPLIYNRTKIVLDDANAVTKAWGSVNSRVYDALAAGCLVLTNGEKGSDAEFEGLLPVYRSSHELHDLLNTFLKTPALLEERASQLRALVLQKHTYEHRVEDLCSQLLPDVRRQRRFAIKIGAPSRAVAQEWGDFHFAESLKRALVGLGHVARIDCLDAWDNPEGYGDDCVIVLRGLSVYKPKPYQCNIIWVVSHPDLVSSGEFKSYDVVLTASEKHRAYLNAQNIPANTLLQCTDPARFNATEAREPLEMSKPIFIGNTRNVYRDVVRYAVESGLDIEVIGAGWKDFIPASFVTADHIENVKVAARYRQAEFVLNDHWESMRGWGFISNRVFDAIACGSPCLSDEVEGIVDIFGEAVVTYKGKNDFEAAAERARMLRARPEVLKDASDRVLCEHSFAERAQTIFRHFEQWERETMQMGDQRSEFEPPDFHR